MGGEGAHAGPAVERARRSGSTSCGGSATRGSSPRSRRTSPRSMVERARRKRRLLRGGRRGGLVVLGRPWRDRRGVSRQQAVRQRERAEAEARRAEASKLVALGRSELERYPTAALAYARKSLELADNAEGRRLAVEVLWRAPSLRVLPVEGGTYHFAFSPDGTRLAAYTFADTVLLYPDDGSPPTAIGGFPMPRGGGGPRVHPEGRRPPGMVVGRSRPDGLDPRRPGAPEVRASASPRSQRGLDSGFRCDTTGDPGLLTQRERPRRRQPLASRAARRGRHDMGGCRPARSNHRRRCG